MKSVLTTTCLSLLLMASLNVMAAVKIVECQDEEGGRSFHKTCPPGTTQVSAKRFSTGSSADDERKVNIQATLYRIPDCDSCDEVKEFLSARNIPMDEKDVSDDLELQNELTDLTGNLQVPTTIIGDEILTGYSRSEFQDALEKAGYQEEES